MISPDDHTPRSGRRRATKRRAARPYGALESTRATAASAPVVGLHAVHHEPLLTKDQLGAVLGGLSVRWVDYRVAEGMPYVRARGRKLFRLSAVLAWLKERG